VGNRSGKAVLDPHHWPSLTRTENIPQQENNA
jgi:hypothetical protein